MLSCVTRMRVECGRACSLVPTPPSSTPTLLSSPTLPPYPPYISLETR